MSRKIAAELVTMCMVYDGDRVLVQDRVDPDWPGVTFPGGHVEPGEAFAEAAIREVYEETGLSITHPQLCGVKQRLDLDGSRYIVFYTGAMSLPGSCIPPTKERTTGWSVKGCRK